MLATSGFSGFAGFGVSAVEDAELDDTDEEEVVPFEADGIDVETFLMDALPLF